MQYLGHNSPESICCFLEFTFSWASCILFGSPVRTSCPLQTSSLGQTQTVGEEKNKLVSDYTGLWIIWKELRRFINNPKVLKKIIDTVCSFIHGAAKGRNHHREVRAETFQMHLVQ